MMDQLSWKDLADQKEKEWKQFTNLRIESLETALQQKERGFNEETVKYQKLKEDFKYNFKLLQERDQELERYDALFTDFKKQVNCKNLEISESKIVLDDIKRKLREEEKAREELQQHYQQRLKGKQEEIDSFRSKTDAELSQERKEFEEFKRSLHQKLTVVEGELDAQKRELTCGFDEAMKKREHEIRVKDDESDTRVLEYELKSKLLSKELEFIKADHQKVSVNLRESENMIRQSENKLKEKDWEVTNNKAITDAKITKLEAEMKEMEDDRIRMEESNDRKYSEMDKCLRERGTALSKVKDAYAEREQTFKNNISELQIKLETAERSIQQLHWTNEDLTKEKDIKILRLREDLQELQEKWDKSVADMSRSQVSRDLEVHCLRENSSKLKAEIFEQRHEIDKYKRDLKSAGEREKKLEQSKAQVEIEWQNRYEDTERVQYRRSENFMKKVADARLEIEEGNFEELNQVRQQNRNLKEVIGQMRKQMESFSHDNTPGVSVGVPNIEKAEVDEQYSKLQTRLEDMESSSDKLAKEFSELKMEMSVSKPAINLGAQELVIKQLQGEIMRLKQNTSDKIESDTVIYKLGTDDHSTVQDLHTKLKKAVKQIATLAKEKQQLIESSNRMRGELMKAGITAIQPSSSHQFVSPMGSGASSHSILSVSSNANHPQSPSNKMNALETLQYQLTKQQLQFAQRFPRPKTNQIMMFK